MKTPPPPISFTEVKNTVELALEEKKYYKIINVGESFISNHSNQDLLTNGELQFVHKYLGLAYEKKEQWDEATTHYEKALQITETTYCLAHLAHCQESNGDLSSAIENYKKAFTLDSNNTFTSLFYANRLYQDGSIEDAINILSHTIEGAPYDEEWEEYFLYQYRGIYFMNLQKYSDAESDLLRSQEMHGETETMSAFAIFKLGESQYYLGKYAESINNLRIAEDIDDQFVHYYTYQMRGYCYYKLKQYDSAILEYQKALNLKNDEDDAELHFWLGMSFKQNESYQNAAISFENAIRLSRNDKFVHYHLGDCYTKTNHFNKAIKAYLKSIEFDSQDKYVLKQLGIAYYENDDFLEAISTQNRALEIDPGYEWSILEKTKSFIALNKLKEAFQTIFSHEEYSNIWRSSTILKLKLCISLSKKQDLLRQLDEIEKKIQENSDYENDELTYCMGISNHFLGNFEAATSLYSKIDIQFIQRLLHYHYCFHLAENGISLNSEDGINQTDEFIYNNKPSDIIVACLDRRSRMTFFTLPDYDYDWDFRRADLETILKYEQNNYEVYYRLAELFYYDDWSGHSESDGYKMILKCLELNEYPPALITLAEKTSDLKESLNLKLRAVELDPTSKQALQSLSSSYYDIKEYMKAVEVLKKIENSDKDEEIQSRIASCYFELKSYLEAVKIYESICTNENIIVNPDWHFMLGKSYDAMGKQDLAIGSIRKAIIEAWRDDQRINYLTYFLENHLKSDTNNQVLEDFKKYIHSIESGTSLDVLESLQENISIDDTSIFVLHPAFSAEEIYHLQKIAKYQTKIHLARNATLDKESIESLLLNAVYTAAEQLCAHPSLDEIYISAIIEQNDESYH